MAFGLRKLAASYKDKFFKDEREIRAVVEIEPTNFPKHDVDERKAYGEKAVYHRLLTSFCDRNAIKEVIIGANCPQTQEDVERGLHEHGLKDVEIRYSSGRGRLILPR